MPQQFIIPKEAAQGSQSWTLAFHLLAETQIWKLGEHEHI